MLSQPLLLQEPPKMPLLPQLSLPPPQKQSKMIIQSMELHPQPELLFVPQPHPVAVKSLIDLPPKIYLWFILCGIAWFCFHIIQKNNKIYKKKYNIWIKYLNLFQGIVKYSIYAVIGLIMTAFTYSINKKEIRGMAAQDRTVAGRTFRTKADYEAALRDEKKIDIIKSKTDMNNPREVIALYNQMQAGNYRFETMVGNDFDDEIYELAEKYKRQPAGDKNKKKKNTGKKRNKSHKAIKGGGKLSLNDFDEDMKCEIEAQLKAAEKKRRFLITLCSLCAAACFGYFAIYYYYAEKTGADYEKLAELKNSEILSSAEKVIVVVGEEEKLELPDILNDYKTLYNKNKKLIGWLKIDDTIIDYPVMQTSNNEYYLTYNFNQEHDRNGSIFMDSKCMAFPRSQNLILYGHHMKSGKMFGDLEKYAKESYYEKHSIIQFDTIYEKGVYQVMYVFRAKVLKENEIAFKYYQFIDAKSEGEFNSYMEEMAEMSLYDTGVTAVYGDELLTLSTCDNSQTDGRFAVVAKRIQ